MIATSLRPIRQYLGETDTSCQGLKRVAEQPNDDDRVSEREPVAGALASPAANERERQSGVRQQELEFHHATRGYG